MNNSSVASAPLNSSSVVCWYSQGSCNNYQEVTSPNLLSLPNGDVGLSYAALANTSQAICGRTANQSISHIVFARSLDRGVHWGATSYLGDTNATCPYNQELEPSFTTNGTGAVLGVYVGANTSLFGLGNTSVYGTPALNPIIGYVNRTSDAIIFANSSNSGSTFSKGTIVVSGANLARPAIATFGRTIYVVFEDLNNSSTPLPDGYAPISVKFVASPDGGATWGAPVILPGENASENYTAMSPSISVSSTGEVAVAYVTNRSCIAYCGPALISSPNSEFGEDVVTATSMNNGSSWRFTTIAHHTGEPVSAWCASGLPCVKGSFVYGNAYGYGGYFGEMSGLFQFAPPTTIAWNTSGLRLFVAWGGSANFTQLNNTPFGAGGYSFQGLYVATSIDAGATWLPFRTGGSSPHTWEQIGAPGGSDNPGNTFLWRQGPGFESISYYDLGLTVSGGTAYLAYQANNQSATPRTEQFYNGGGNEPQCGFASFPGFDQATVEWLVQSSDGQDWSAPLPAVVQGPPSIYNSLQPYIAYSSSVLIDNGSPIIATSLPQSTGNYAPGSQLTNLDVATVNRGATYSVIVGESGLPSGTTWSAAVSGNTFTQSTASVAVNVPASSSFYVQTLTTTVTVAGVRYEAYTPGGEYTLPNTTNVTIRYTSVQPLYLTQNGAVNNFLDLRISDLAWGFGYYNVTQNMIVPSCLFFCTGGNLFVGCPMPWYLPTGYLLNVTPADLIAPNLTVASGAIPTYWAGSGAGNHTGTGFPYSIVMNNPINETMWTLPYGEYGVHVGAPALPPSSNFTFAWDGVAQAAGPGGGSVLVPSVPTGVHRVTHTIGTSATPGWIYVGSPPGGGPIIVPSTLSVNLTFAYIDVGAPLGVVSFHAANLTNGTAWQLEFNGTTFSSDTPWINITTHSGTFSIAASSATAPDAGSGYVASGLGPTISVVTGAVVVVNYSPAYKVVIAASTGGAVSPSGVQWFLPGQTTPPLLAVAARGFSFVGWSGTGMGSYEGTASSPTLIAGGPIVELASFVALPLDRYDLNFSQSGVPAGVPWEVNVKGTPYPSTSTQLVVPDLRAFPASYLFTVPYIDGSDPTNATRYIAQPGSGTVVAGTGYDNHLVFETQHYLTLTSTSGGAVLGLTGAGSGSGWFSSGMQLTLAATPAVGYSFVGWVGTGPGSYSGPSAFPTLQPSGSITELATFGPSNGVPTPTGRVTFQLARPIAAGTTWTVKIGTSTYASSGNELNLTGMPTGTVSANVPTAYSPDGLSQFSPQNSTVAIRVTTTATIVEVTFGAAYWVSIHAVGPGTVNPVSSWVGEGHVLSIAAHPSVGSALLTWQGIGTGAYSGADSFANVTVRDPISEVATFGQSTLAAGAAAPPFLTSEAGIVTLAIIGLLVGLATGLYRWRRGGPRQPTMTIHPSSPESREDGKEDAGAEPVLPPSTRPAFRNATLRSHPSPPAARIAAGTFLAIAIVLLSGLAGLPHGGSTPTGAPGSIALLNFGVAATSSSHSPVASGWGAFWSNSLVPNVTRNGVCLGVDTSSFASYQPLCGPTNITNEPSLNLSSNGVLVSAYTAYTNWTPCENRYPMLANYTFTQVGISTSRNGGANWSTPVYLGNKVCGNATTAGNYLNAWQPSVTSLANGTLAVAFVEFNLSYRTGCTSCYYPFPRVFHADFPYSHNGASDYNSSQLVVAFSYDDGARWTDPVPVNTSTIGGTWCASGCRTFANWIQQKPSLNAYGQTLYLTWTNVTIGWYAGWIDSGFIYSQARQYCATYGFKLACPEADSGVQLAVSPNGNASFGAPIELPVTTTPGNNLSVAANPSVLVTPNGTVVVAYATNLTVNYTRPTAGVENTQMYSGYNGGPDLVGACAFRAACGGFLSDVAVAQSTDNGTSWTMGTAARSVYDSQGYDAGFYQQVQMQDYVNAGDRLLPSPQATYDPASRQVVLAYVADEVINGSASNGWTRPEVFVANGSLVTNSWSSHVVTAWSGLGNGTLNGLVDSYFYNPAIVTTSTGSVYLTAQFVNGSACTTVPAGSYLAASGLLFTQFFGALVPAFPYCGEGLQVYGVSTDNGTTFGMAHPVDPMGTWYDLMSPGLRASMLAHGNEVWAAWTQTQCPGWNGTTPIKCDMLYDYAGNYPPEGGFTSNTSVVVSRLFLGAGVTVTFNESGLPSGSSWGANLSGNYRSGLAGASLTVSGVPTGTPFDWIAWNVSAGPGAQYHPTPSLAGPSSFTTNTTITWTYVEQFTLTINSTPGYLEGAGIEVWLNEQGYCDGAGGALSWETEYAFDPNGLCNFGSTSINYNLTPGIGTRWVDAGTPFTIEAIPLNASGYWCTTSYGCEANYANLTFQAWTGTGAGSYNGTSNTTRLTLNGPVHETVSFWLNAHCLWANGTFTTTGGWASACLPGGFTASFLESGLPSGTSWGAAVWGAGYNQTVPIPVFGNSTTLSVLDPALHNLVYFEPYTVPSNVPGKVWVPVATPSSPLLGPLDGLSLVDYTLRTTSSVSFNSIVQQVGLPNGTAWSYSIDGGGSGLNASLANLSLLGGRHTFTANPVYFSNGTGFVAQSIDIRPFVMNESWWNTSSFSTTYTFNGSAAILVNFTPIDELTAQASAGGSVSNAGTSWVPLSGTVSLRATADAGYHFVGWTGRGPDALSKTSLEINVTFYTPGPDWEFATFAPNASAVYVVTVTATGLLPGGSYSMVFNGTTYSGNGTFALPAYGAGAYSITAPVAYDNSSSLVRFLPVSFSTTGLGSGPGGTFVLSSDGAVVTILYSTQYAFTIGVAGGGTTAPVAGEYWETGGNITTLTATPSPGNLFVGWTGTGNSSVNSTTATILSTSTGPITETAQFIAKVAVPPATFTLTVHETGLPGGTQWSVSTGATGSGSVNSTDSLGDLNGTFSVSVPAILIGQGVRYVTNMTSRSVSVVSNLSLNITFTLEYLLTMVAGSGGIVNPGTEWVSEGSRVALTAAARTGYTFVGWNGSGAGNFGGTQSLGSVTMSSPILETALFAANGTAAGAGAENGGGSVPLYSPWMALAALLVVGFAVGYLIRRRKADVGP